MIFFLNVNGLEPHIIKMSDIQQIATKLLILLLIITIITAANLDGNKSGELKNELNAVKLNKYFLDKLQSYINYHLKLNKPKINNNTTTHYYYNDAQNTHERHFNCNYIIINKHEFDTFYVNYKIKLLNRDFVNIKINNNDNDIDDYGDDYDGMQQGIYIINTNCLNNYLNTYIENEINNLDLIVIGIEFLHNNRNDFKLNYEQFLNDNFIFIKNSSYIKYLNFNNTDLNLSEVVSSDYDSLLNEDDMYVMIANGNQVESRGDVPLTTEITPSLKNLYFNRFNNLEILVLDNNKNLNLYNNVFNNLVKLKYLSINKCNLMSINLTSLFNDDRLIVFDYIGLSGNNLTTFDINNYFVIQNINEINLSNNQISNINYNLINNLQIRFLNYDYNLIKNVNFNLIANSSSAKSNDLTLSLKNNLIETITNKYQIKINLYLAGNPLICDCNSIWLFNYNNNNINNMIKIIDYNKLDCLFLNTNNMQEIGGLNNGKYFKNQIVNSNYNDFICEYKQNCNYMCKCCGYRHCYCLSKCPSKCKCYINSNSTENIVDCSNLNFENDDKMITSVESASELRLINTNLKEFRSSLLFGYTKLKSIYLNKNQIETIDLKQFDYLKDYLQIIDLSSNKLSSIDVNDILKLKNLKIINLSNNSIHTIDETLYLLNKNNLPYLELIDLSNNNLTLLSSNLIQNFVSNNSNIKVSFDKKYDTTIELTTTPTSTTTSTSTSDKYEPIETEIQVLKVEDDIFSTQINEKGSLEITKTTNNNLNSYSLNINNAKLEINYYKILKICLLSLSIGSLVLLLILFLVYILHKLNAQYTTYKTDKINEKNTCLNASNDKKNEIKKKYHKLCKQINCNTIDETQSMSSELTSTTGSAVLTSVTSILPPINRNCVNNSNRLTTLTTSTVSTSPRLSSISTTNKNYQNPNDYFFIKNEYNDANNQSDSDNDDNQKPININNNHNNVNFLNDKSTIIASKSLNDINLLINVYYNHLDNEFINSYLRPIIQNINIIPNKQIVLKPQINSFIDLSIINNDMPQTSHYHYHNSYSHSPNTTIITTTTTTTTTNTSCTNTPYNNLSNYQTTLCVNIIIISQNFQGIQPLNKHAKKLNKKSKQVKNLIKIYISSQHNDDKVTEIRTSDEIIKHITRIDDNNYEIIETTMNSKRKFCSTNENSLFKKQKLLGLNLLKNQFNNKRAEKHSNSVNIESIQFESSIKLEVKLNLYIESLYQKMKLNDEEEDIDFHLGYYRRTSNLSQNI